MYFVEDEIPSTASAAAAVRRRKPRTSAAQHQCFIDFATANRSVLDPLSRNFNSLWEELVEMLNAALGPNRSKREWQEVRLILLKLSFVNMFVPLQNLKSWEYQLRSKNRQIIAGYEGTGGGPTSTKLLTALENRAIAVFGRILVEGNPMVPQLGFPAPSSVDAPASHREQLPDPEPSSTPVPSAPRRSRRPVNSNCKFVLNGNSCR